MQNFSIAESLRAENGFFRVVTAVRKGKDFGVSPAPLVRSVNAAMSSSPSWANARKSLSFIHSPASINHCVYIHVFEQLCRVEATNLEAEKLKKESVLISEVEILEAMRCDTH